MKKLLSLFLSLTTLVSCAQKESSGVLEFVDPFIGTDGIVHTFPGATTPFGMVQLSPDGGTKGWNWCSGYHASDSSIMGFSHTHLSGTGWSDLGDILVMPTVGDIQFTSGTKEDPDSGYRSRISHDADKEVATAGYYSVDLLDYGIKAELTATPRAGIHRYTFPKSDESNIIIDPTNKIFGSVSETYISILNNETVEGYCTSNGWGGKRTTYFTASFSKPFISHTIYTSEKESTKAIEAVAKDAKVALTFNTSEGEAIELKVAISMVDQEGARKNYAAEAADIDFKTAHNNAVASWNDKLSKYQFETDDIVKKRILYTGLYHTMIQPNLSQDVDGRYWAQGKILNADGFTNYSTFSLWDTFRAVHPLFSITEHEVTTDIVNSLVSRHKTGGTVPLWELCGHDNTCMISYPAAAVISEAIVKGIGGINAEEALEALVAASNHDYTSSSDGESGVEYYNRLGYVPAGIPASVSKTAENSYYDWCIAQIAKEVGDTARYDEYMERSLRFMNHFDKESGLLLPKDSLGNFVEVDLNSWKSLLPHYVSGNIWAYSYFYPHAVDVVIDAMGGADKFVEAMDKTISTPLNMKGEQHVDISGFFGQYGHGDEPGHQFAYLYSMAGAPEKSGLLTNMVADSLYKDIRNGMPNNDDCGQMSAWYIFSSMGFYPVSPASATYIIGAPRLDKAVINTDNGTQFTMIAHNLSDENRVVKSVTLNGKPLVKSQFTHEDIMKGGTLEFVMGK